MKYFHAALPDRGDIFPAGSAIEKNKTRSVRFAAAQITYHSAVQPCSGRSFLIRGRLGCRDLELTEKRKSEQCQVHNADTLTFLQLHRC